MRKRSSLALAGAVAFAALSSVGCVDWYWEPQGSCFFTATPDQGGPSQACIDGVTANQCANDFDGQFDEGGNCILFDIFSGGPR